MKTKSELIAAAAALTIALPTAAGASRSSASPSDSQTIKFALAFHDVQVDLGKKGPSVGDTQILADSLLDAKGKKVGHDAGVCTFTSLAPPEAACQITFFLSSGQIATQFLNTPPPHKVAAIVGGTGAYRGARGQAVIVENRNQTGTISFQLTG
jgi:allene oxide cyclase-like protein